MVFVHVWIERLLWDSFLCFIKTIFSCAAHNHSVWMAEKKAQKLLRHLNFCHFACNKTTRMLAVCWIGAGSNRSANSFSTLFCPSTKHTHTQIRQHQRKSTCKLFAFTITYFLCALHFVAPLFGDYSTCATLWNRLKWKMKRTEYESCENQLRHWKNTLLRNFLFFDLWLRFAYTFLTRILTWILTRSNSDFNFEKMHFQLQFFVMCAFFDWTIRRISNKKRENPPIHFSLASSADDQRIRYEHIVHFHQRNKQMNLHNFKLW